MENFYFTPLFTEKTWSAEARKLAVKKCTSSGAFFFGLSFFEKSKTQEVALA